MTTRLDLRARALAALLPLLVTAPRFWNGFVFDDVFMIVRGDFIHDPRNLPTALTARAMVASSLNAAVGNVALDTYRPLSIATFFWDAAWSGRAPWSYHLTNALLHAGVVLLVQALLARLVPTLGVARATVLACLFGLAPWLTEAHVFINGRSDVLLALFAVGAMLVHARALVTGSWPRASVTGLLVLAGLLAKETMVAALPFVLLVPTPLKLAWRTRITQAAPSVLALGAYLAARTHALGGMHAQTDAATTLKALTHLPLLWLDTLTHTALPTPYVLRSLRDDYDGASSALRLVALAVLALTNLAIGYALFRRQVRVAWAVGLGFCTIAPAAMISTALWQGFGRYLYLPAVGITVLIALGLDALLRLLANASPLARRLVASVPVGLCVLSALLTVDATRGFHSDETLYVRALAAHPEQAWTYGALGMALRRAGRCPEAIPMLAHAEKKASHEPRYAVHRARCLIETGNLDGARAVVRQARARFAGTRAEAGLLVAEFLTLARGDPAAASLMKRCLELAPDRPDCLEGLALARAEPSR
ncbi:MAG: hypothetical protein ABW252_22665 [Polyangiales bacterium]